MRDVPDWLPSPLTFEGDWEAFVRQAYSVFEKDLKVYPKPVYRGYVVFHDRRLIGSDKEEGFWHLISREDHLTKERLPEIARAARIPWIRAVIENAHKNDVVAFDHREARNKVRTYLWVQRCDYVVILEKKRTVAFLVTAYNIDNDLQRKKLDKKFNNRL